MEKQTREEPRIVAAAERQMRNWELTEELAKRAAQRGQPERGVQQAIRFVTISREAGAGGAEIAQLVGRKLGWEVFDRSLLDQIAERYHLPRAMLELVDETKASWAYDVFGTFLDRKLVSHDRYLIRLVRTVRMVAHRGPGVFVGRGVQFCLPRPLCLAVRIIASETYRARRLMERQQCDAIRREST